MKIQELRQLDSKKLNDLLAKTVRELAVFRFHVATGQQKDTAKIRGMRRMIAQIKTLMNN